jgi:hypothetical protein
MLANGISNIDCFSYESLSGVFVREARRIEGEATVTEAELVGMIDLLERRPGAAARRAYRLRGGGRCPLRRCPRSCSDGGR